MAGQFKMGWIRDLPDVRDHVFAAPRALLRQLPAKVDLRPNFRFDPYDQGHIGSCTANAIAGAIQYTRVKAEQTPDFTPSRLFIYYNERAAEHTIPIDNGAMIRTGIKSVAKLGVCKEETWPYDDTPADPDTNLFPPTSKAILKPSAQAYKEALNFQVLSYTRLTQSLQQLKACLAAGFPFTLGFAVYSSLYDDADRPKTIVPLPSPTDTHLGGHAVLGVGYDDETQRFIIRNSWGTDVQDKGYFYLPYAYVLDANLASDFWTIRMVES